MSDTTTTTIVSVNPTTEEVIKSFDALTPQQVDAALSFSRRAFESWRDVPFARRAEMMRAAASNLRVKRAQYAALITQEMGKPVVEAESEIDKCAWACDYYSENAEAFLRDQDHPSAAAESYVSFHPLGTILAVMPWNFPFWQLFRFAAPALMAGNTALLKHASNVPQCAIAIEQLFRESGFPDGVFQTLLISGASAEKLLDDPRIAAVTLTGSTDTGRRIASAAGRALKKSVLELGGSDPFIVLEDADLEQAAQVGARARNQNAGQSCIAAKRFVVVESVADEFLERLAAAIGALKVGDPMDRSTKVGPLARGDLRDAVADQVRASVNAGAGVRLGGRRPDGRGYFYPPTLLTNVTRDMVAFREEVFGPVAAVIRARDENEAIAYANDTDYGLGSNLWTRDIERAKRLARRIEAGNVFINGMTSSDPHLPFGGVKQSGYGRELSEYGVKEFVNIQSVWIGPPASPLPPQEPSTSVE